ncbi:MAG: carbon monoxide dehydrogenase [Verrucomicrobia bacterium]|nr:carbon monoxide dehydrogenase [Verrucomicrobiota bacterium]
MKLAVTGKGGVGKTTFTVLLAHALQKGEGAVTVIDADPNTNLAAAIGCPNAGDIKPLIELKDMIEERTGVKPGSTGGMFRLNPFVEDIPSKYAVKVDGINVLVAGGLKKGGSGCYCPENALVRALVSHLLLERNGTLILDMEAGIEHLSRATVASVDFLLIVVEPGSRSAETARRINVLAGELGIPRVAAVGNKIRHAGQQGQMARALPELVFAGFIPFDEAIYEAETMGKPVLKAGKEVKEAIQEVVDFLKNTGKKR